MTQKHTPLASHKKNTILLINTGSAKKRFILQRLKKLDVKVVAVHKEKNWAQAYVSDWIIVDTERHDLTIRAVGKYLKNHSVDGVITFWEDDVLLTAKIAEKFHLIGTPYHIVKKIRNKFRFREFCRQNQLPVPQFVKIDSEEDIENSVRDLQFPVVIKPIYGSSSAYVIKANDKKELLEVYSFLQKNISTKVESALKDGISLIIEEYIDGDEVDIDILVQNGKIKFFSITDNFQTQEPFFVETGQLIPSVLPDSSQYELIRVAEICLEKLGVMDGIVHFEAKYSKKGPVPIEINLRMGGDEVHSFVKEAWGVDLIKYAVKIAVGEYFPRIKKPSEAKKYLAGKYFLPSKSGIISSLDLPKKVNKQIPIQELNFYKQVGDVVFTPPDDFEYLGWITVVGDNPNDARDNLEKAFSIVEYEIAPFSEESVIGKTDRQSPFKVASIKKNAIKSKAKIERLRYVDVKNQRKLTIGIACNAYSEIDGSVEAELTAVGTNIEHALQAKGYKTLFIDFNNLEQAIDTIRSNQIDLVFNVGERLNNSSLLEPHIAAIFDSFQIPYTGSNPFTLSLAIDKIKVKKLLTFHAIPTPKWDYIYSLDDDIDQSLHYPLIVKPANTDNSIGITNDSVVKNKKELDAQLEYVINELKRPALIEEYMNGDEYDVSILGSEDDDLIVLPLSRTIFSNLPDDYWHIYPFEAKFTDQAAVYKKYIEVQRPPKNVSIKLLSLITEIALDTYNILDCHDYGRVEIKLDENNNPHVLELNPNPSINMKDCLPQVAKMTGLEYGDFLEKIIALCIKRYKNRPPYYHLQSIV